MVKVKFEGNYDKHEICFHKKSQINSTFLDTSKNCYHINITDSLISISFPNNQINYGETYLFYIKTYGCQLSCFSMSNVIEGRTGKILLSICLKNNWRFSLVDKELDVVKLPINQRVKSTSKSLIVEFDKSYDAEAFSDRISIECIPVNNDSIIIYDTCMRKNYTIYCECINLTGSTEYKMVISNERDGWVPRRFNLLNHFTSK